MSVLKAELRADVLHEVGIRFDDHLEGAKAEAQRYEGAKQALWQAVHKVEDHLTRIDQDLRDGKYEEIQQAEREKRRVQECAGILRNLAVTAEVNQYIARGKSEALEQAIKNLKGQHDQERLRALQLKTAEQKALTSAETSAKTSTETPDDSGRPGNRIVGTHPGLSIKEQRLAETPKTEQSTTDVEPTVSVPIRTKKRRR